MAYAIPVSAYEEHLNCSICMEIFNDPRALPCLHTFCRQCLHSYITNVATRSHISDGFECPVCRAEIPPPGPDLDLPVESWAGRYPPNYTVKGLVEEALNEATRHIDAITHDEQSTMALKCDKHVGKDAEFFCKDHDIYCCSMCAALKHRKCETLVYLGNVSDASLPSDEDFEDDSAGTTITKESRANERVNKKHRTLSRLSRCQHRHTAEQDDTCRDSVDVLAKDFERAVVIVGCTSGTTIYEEYDEESAESSVGRSDSWLENEPDTESNNGQETNDIENRTKLAQLNRQHSHMTMEHSRSNENDCAVTDVTTNLPTTTRRELSVTDMGLSDLESEMPTLQYKIVLQGEYSISVPEDIVSCSVTGITSLPDGRVLLVDTNNSQIKMFTNACEYLTHISLPWQPFGIATVKAREAVVSFPDKMFLQIMLISGNSFVSGRIIHLPKTCFGVACCLQEIYVALEDEVRIIDTDGSTLSIIPKDKKRFTADPLFNNARHIAVSQTASGCPNVFVTDNVKGSLTCVKRTGKYVCITEYKTGNPLSITTTPTGMLFMCSAPSRLLQIGIVNKGALMQNVMELDKIQTVHVNDYDNKLWVACRNNDCVRLYESRPTLNSNDTGLLIYQGDDHLI